MRADSAPRDKEPGGNKDSYFPRERNDVEISSGESRAAVFRGSVLRKQNFYIFDSSEFSLGCEGK